MHLEFKKKKSRRKSVMKKHRKSVIKSAIEKPSLEAEIDNERLLSAEMTTNGATNDIGNKPNVGLAVNNVTDIITVAEVDDGEEENDNDDGVLDMNLVLKKKKSRRKSVMKKHRKSVIKSAIEK